MGNFCGTKPSKNSRHQLSEDSISFHAVPPLDEDLINKLVDQWQGSLIEYFKQRFKESATQEDGSLDQADFIKIFPQISFLPKNVKKKAFEFFDRNRNGRVDFREFCQSISVCCKSDLEQKIVLLFRLFCADADMNATMTRAEMIQLLKSCSSYVRGGASGEAETLAQLFPTKKHERISFSAFAEWASSNFNISEFFQMFELIPDPLQEREIIRTILNEQRVEEKRLNQLLIDSKKLSQGEDDDNDDDDEEGQHQLKKEIIDKEHPGVAVAASAGTAVASPLKTSETLYVVSWKWWFMWKYYINYARKNSKLAHKQLQLMQSQQHNNQDTAEQQQQLQQLQQQQQDLHLTQQQQTLLVGGNKLTVEGSMNLLGVSNVALQDDCQDSDYIGSPRLDAHNEVDDDEIDKKSSSSRNSIVDLEFNNSIPSERQEEVQNQNTRLQYNLQPNAFKNNLDFALGQQQQNDADRTMTVQGDPDFTYMNPNRLIRNTELLDDAGGSGGDAAAATGINQQQVVLDLNPEDIEDMQRRISVDGHIAQESDGDLIGKQQKRRFNNNQQNEEYPGSVAIGAGEDEILGVSQLDVSKQRQMGLNWNHGVSAGLIAGGGGTILTANGGGTLVENQTMYNEVLYPETRGYAFDMRTSPRIGQQESALNNQNGSRAVGELSPRRASKNENNGRIVEGNNSNTVIGGGGGGSAAENFTPTKFHLCRPLQGLQGEPHDLLSQEDVGNAQNKVIGAVQAAVANSSSYVNNNNHKVTSSAGVNKEEIEETERGIQNTDQDDEEEGSQNHQTIGLRNGKTLDNLIHFQEQIGLNLGDRPPQIDNCDIEGEYEGELQTNLMKNHHYITIPKKAWESLFGWYGGGPVFKRKRIVDLEKGFLTIELFPPLLIGYKLKKNGEINYDTRIERLVSSWKSLREVQSKFERSFERIGSHGKVVQKDKKKVAAAAAASKNSSKKNKGNEDILYYKKMGSEWKREAALDDVQLINLQVESGAVFLFMPQALEANFLEKQSAKKSSSAGQKQQSQQSQQQSQLLDGYEIGDRICIFHPSERVEKQGFIFNIKGDLIQIHFKRESYRNDITFEKKQLAIYVRESSGEPVSQLNALDMLDIVADGQQQQQQLQQKQKQQHVKYQPKMIGLANLGNTCFINCVVQFLVHTPFFRQYLIDEIYLDRVVKGTTINSSSNANNNSEGNDGIVVRTNGGGTGSKKDNPETSLIRQLAQLAKLLKSKPYNDVYDPVRPQSLKKAIDIAMPAFSGHEQHDAQEFLNSFLDNLNDEVKIKKLVVPAKKIEENKSNNSPPILPAIPTISVEAVPAVPVLDAPASSQPEATTILIGALATQSEEAKKDTNTIQQDLPNKKDSQQESTTTATGGATAATNAMNATTTTTTSQSVQAAVKQQFQEFSIIKDVYMGQTVNMIQCEHCNNKNEKVEDFYSLTLPLPPSKGVLYEVTFVPRLKKDQPHRPITKYGVRVSRHATFGDFQHAFEKLSKINLSTVVFAEVYKSQVFRNLFNINSDVPMRNLGIRSDDQIVVFEVTTLHQDLEAESLSIQQGLPLSNKSNLRSGDFVDYQLHQRWVHAFVEEVQPPTAHNKETMVVLRVFEDHLKPSLYTSRERRESSRVQPFRSMNPFYPHVKGFVVFIMNRRPHNNSMEKFGLPLCLVVPAWLTWRELHLLVYAQIKRSIDFQYLEKRHEVASKASQTKQKGKKKKGQGYTRLQGDEFDAANAAAGDLDFDAVKSNNDYFYDEVADADAVAANANYGANFNNYNSNYANSKQAQQNSQQQMNFLEVRKKAPSFHVSADDCAIGTFDHVDANQQLKAPFNGLQKGYSVIRPSMHLKYDSQYAINQVDQQHHQDPFSKHQTEGRRTHQQQASTSKQQQDSQQQHQQQRNQAEAHYFQAIADTIKDEVEFLGSSHCPYRLRVIDQATHRCAICDLHLFPDSKLGREFCCGGCEKGIVDRPIYWDIKQTNMIIAIDWKDSLSVNPSSMVPVADKSYIDLKKEKNEVKMGVPISECFKIFSAQEHVEIECEKCKKKQTHSTQLQLHKLPNILIVHLSRFQFLNGLFEKIDDLVSFPLKRLDVSEWTSKKTQTSASGGGSPQQQQQQQKISSHDKTSSMNKNAFEVFSNNDVYDLIAVVNHIGNGHGGHYTSFVNISDEQNDCWVNFDDEQVNYATTDAIVSNKAYLLIYKKKFSTSAIVNLTYKKL